MNDLDIIEKLKAERIALEGQRAKEVKEYSEKILRLNGVVNKIKENIEAGEKYLTEKVKEEFKKVLEMQDQQEKEIKECEDYTAKAIETNESAKVKEKLAEKILNNAEIAKGKSNKSIKEREESLNDRLEDCTKTEVFINRRVNELEDFKASLYVTQKELHKEAHEGSKRLTNIVVHQESVDRTLEDIKKEKKRLEDLVDTNKKYLSGNIEAIKSNSVILSKILAKEFPLVKREEAVKKQEEINKSNAEVNKDVRVENEKRLLELKKLAKDNNIK